MNTDRRNLYLISAFIPVALITLLFVQTSYFQMVAAVILAVSAVASTCLIKKRGTLSVNYRSVAALLAVVAIVYLVITYLLGIPFGFRKNVASLSLQNILLQVLPAIAIIVCSELVRRSLVIQSNTVATVSAYVICLIADIMLSGGFANIEHVSQFVDAVCLVLFPSAISNLLYHYLSKRYGASPVIVYRIILTVPLSLLPILPNISGVVNSFLLIVLPLLVWKFIDMLYEKKEKYALGKKEKAEFVGIAVSITCMVLIILLISGLLAYKFIVIATPSMTGAINEGDGIIYEEYDGQIIEVGSVVVFTRNDEELIVHRVIAAQQIDGTVYYTTKGDANSSSDSGFITNDNIIGIVKIRVPYVGYPSLWLRELFS